MLEDRLIARIAELFYIHEMDQYEIAKKFNFSKSKVCRIIKEAKRKKIVEIVIKDFNKRQSDLEKVVEAKYKLQEAIIYFNESNKEYDENILFQEVGLLAADFLKRVLKDNLNIALTWGKTLFYLIKNLEVEKKYNINVFSTLGGVSLTKTEYQNNNLIQMLCEKIGGNCYPIYLPLILENKEYRNILINDLKINTILKDTSKIDYYFTGLGTIEENSRMYTLGGFDKKFLEELRDKQVCGEIGLNFYDINGNFVKTSIEGCIVHLDISEIKKMKNKVIMAFGKSKIDSLKGFLKTNIANLLITDSFTANRLLKD
jgi:deoxyribonucleoside regulator